MRIRCKRYGTIYFVHSKGTKYWQLLLRGRLLGIPVTDLGKYEKLVPIAQAIRKLKEV